MKKLATALVIIVYSLPVSLALLGFKLSFSFFLREILVRNSFIETLVFLLIMIVSAGYLVAYIFMLIKVRKGNSRQKKKTIGLFGVLFVVCGIIFYCLMSMFVDLIDNTLPKSDIYKLVNENYTMILEDIRENDFSDTKNFEGIQQIKAEEKIVDFYCGVVGIGPAGTCVGFYYSEDDQPKEVCAGDIYENSDLEPYEDGFCIINSAGHIRYHTEKIRDNFYYYVAYF